jgi:hypothetical protein
VTAAVAPVVDRIAVAVACPRPQCGAQIGEPCADGRSRSRVNARPHIERHDAWQALATATVVTEVACARGRWDGDFPALLCHLSRAELILTAAACIGLVEGMPS